MDDFENDFQDTTSAWHFKLNCYITTFDIVLLDCHRIVGGILLDHQLKNINLRRVFLVYSFKYRE